MKKTLLLLVLPAFLFACQGTGDKKQSETAVQLEVAPENIGFLEISVEGMTCTGCENSVEKSVLALEGVLDVEASHIDKTALVKYDKTRANPNDMMTKINDKGYEALGYKIKEETE